VVEESYKYYNEWRRATPMERLRISPESVVVKMDPTLHRTEQRGNFIAVEGNTIRGEGDGHC